jgi:NADH:ubiquinone oxidoreductase subunit 3 (subunit A)
MMMIRDILLSPPVAACVFLALAYGLYRLGGVLSPEGQDHPGKCEPYACGEEIASPEAKLAYHTFFQLALMFSTLHLATLVASTLPPTSESHRLAILYLMGIIISVLALTGRRRD